MDQRPARRVLERFFGMNDVINFDEIDEHGPQSYEGHFEVLESDIDRDEVAGNGTIDLTAVVDQGDSGREYVADGTSRVCSSSNSGRMTTGRPLFEPARSLVL